MILSKLFQIIAEKANENLTTRKYDNSQVSIGFNFDKGTWITWLQRTSDIDLDHVDEFRDDGNVIYQEPIDSWHICYSDKSLMDALMELHDKLVNQPLLHQEVDNEPSNDDNEEEEKEEEIEQFYCEGCGEELEEDSLPYCADCEYLQEEEDEEEEYDEEVEDYD